ncbi:MAG: hypothetical protein ACLVJU_13765 [Blautia sp.]
MAKYTHSPMPSQSSATPLRAAAPANFRLRIIWALRPSMMLALVCSRLWPNKWGRHRRGGFEIDIQVMAVLLRRKQRVLRRIFRGLAAGGITEFAVVFIQQFLHRQTQNTA